LEQIGHHEVIWVAEGELALQRGLAESFDLILLDEMMPKMNGVEVCGAYKNSGRQRAPVIFLSANPQSHRVVEMAPVAIGYIAKPFDPMSLCQQIDAILAGANRPNARKGA
jgi:DNA-binding response OmpR family regulator